MSTANTSTKRKRVSRPRILTHSLARRACMTRACIGICLFIASSVVADEPPVSFNQDIRPILSNRCFRCHGPDKESRVSELRLDIEKSAKAKLDNGVPTIVPGSPAKSHLISRITSNDDDLKMPPGDSGPPLSPREIKLLTRWIKQGANWQRHWSLISPKRPTIPPVKSRAWSSHPIDRFVLARLERHPKPLRPSRAADRVTLIRRLHFDLTGLPPTPSAVDAFVKSTRPDAVDRLVDGLLASPHFGERMAIYWLDLVRYADSVGYHGDQDRQISPYRTYVIRSFNQNLPFDQFTIEQLAGDLLPKPTLWQRVASGYNMLGMTTVEGGAQAKEYLAKYAADRVRTTSGVWMAATLGCAECHDHKFDAYSTKDFYRFAAFFADVQQKGKANPKPNLTVPTASQSQQLKELERELGRLRKLKKPTKAQASQIKQLNSQRKRLSSSFVATIMTVSSKPRLTRIFPRGDWLDESGKIVQPEVPESLGLLKVKGRRANRLDLARWLVKPDHPQTSRVFVNRLWRHFLGNGLSNVLDDIGSQGEWPTHPALLDWLAVEFVESGWDIKHMVRLIVTSRTYQQMSVPSKQLRTIDPANRLFARQSRYRLDAELVRDNALSVSGLLVHRLNSHRARPYQPKGYYAHLNFPKRKYQPSSDEQQFRRGVYVHWQRTFLHPALLAFDAPSREECTAMRPMSNTPQAALALLNDPTMVEAARSLAQQMVKRSGSDREKISWVWRRVLSRRPTVQEQQLLLQLLNESRAYFRNDKTAAKKLLQVGITPVAKADSSELASWTNTCRAILNLNESITRN